MLKPRVFEAVVAILLLFLGLVMSLTITAGNEGQFDAWNLTSGGPVSDIRVGDDGTLYVLSGNNFNIISAIDPTGNVKWKLVLPDNWQAASRFAPYDGGGVWYAGSPSDDTWEDQMFTFDGGQMYLYVGEINTTGWDHDAQQGMVFSPGSGGFRKSLVAISTQGKILWKQPISGLSLNGYSASIYALNGRVYVKEYHTVTVVASNGTLLYNVTDMTGDPTVDSDNNLYVNKVSVSNYRYVYRDDGYVECYYPDGTLRCIKETAVLNQTGEEQIYSQTGIIECYLPDGTLGWKKDLGANVRFFVPSRFRGFNTDLLYYNGTLIVPVQDAIYFLDRDGNVVRKKDCAGLNYEFFQPSPVDSQGNLYLLLNTYPPFLDVVSPDNADHLREDIDVVIPDIADNFCEEGNFTASFKGSGDGIVYYLDYFPSGTGYENFTDGDLIATCITARDELHNETLWNYTIVPVGTELAITSDNVDSLTYILGSITYLNLTQSGVNATRYIDYYHANSDRWALLFADRGDHYGGMRVAAGNETVYVNYYSYALPDEITPNNSTCVYSNYIYALAKNGTLLWQKPVLTQITTMAVNNSTLYYGTRDGRLFAENTGLIAGGFTLAAALYLFVRFFLAGTVSRARDRLNKNENRNGIITYVEDHPGSTLRDISRGLGMNIGTVRYHTLILGVNHRISAIQADDKHVRYFTASGQYSMDDRLVMSLVRRDGMKKVLGILVDKPGLSNTDLSRELNMKESAVSRYMKVLTAKGVVERRPVSGGSLAYTINGKLLESVDRAVKHGKS